jgi:hypothetical protein
MAGLSTSWLNRCRVSPNPLIVIPAQAGIQEWRRGIRVRTLARPWDTGLRRCDELGMTAQPLANSISVMLFTR